MQRGKSEEIGGLALAARSAICRCLRQPPPANFLFWKLVATSYDC